MIVILRSNSDALLRLTNLQSLKLTEVSGVNDSMMTNIGLLTSLTSLDISEITTTGLTTQGSFLNKTIISKSQVNYNKHKTLS